MHICHGSSLSLDQQLCRLGELSVLPVVHPVSNDWIGLHDGHYTRHAPPLLVKTAPEVNDILEHT